MFMKGPLTPQQIENCGSIIESLKGFFAALIINVRLYFARFDTNVVLLFHVPFLIDRKRLFAQRLADSWFIPLHLCMESSQYATRMTIFDFSVTLSIARIYSGASTFLCDCCY